jgi:hypothetical protein
MSTMIIQDLSNAKELSSNEMAAVRGGEPNEKPIHLSYENGGITATYGNGEVWTSDGVGNMHRVS